MDTLLQSIEIVLMATGITLFALTLKTLINTIERVGRTADRIEAAAGVVATELAIAQQAVDGVASDLSDAHDRANAVSDDAGTGAAADAGFQLPPREE